jgi:hypothetical protein
MSNRRFNSRALRQLAEELIQKLADDEPIPETEGEDFVTSLVRQWITYDGNATFFVGDQQVYLLLSATPLGQPCIVPEPVLPGWLNRLQEDWKIDSEQFPEILHQLNLGQSAEVINTEGIPLRLWVNPKERSKGVEPLVDKPVPSRTKRDYRKIATDVLEQQMGLSISEEEIDELACSVAKQWQHYEGNACLFLLAGDIQLVLTATENGDGNCQIAAIRQRSSLQAVLSSLGVAPQEMHEVIARINLGQTVEFRDQKGIPSLLWHDPKQKQLLIRPIAPAAHTPTPPVFCRTCTGVLPPWREDEQQQTCPHCGNTISRV